MTPIDPAQGFGLTPEARTAERIANLERRLAALETGSAIVKAGSAAPTQLTRDGTLHAMDDGAGTRRLWVRVGGAWRYTTVALLEALDDAPAHGYAHSTIKSGPARLAPPGPCPRRVSSMRTAKPTQSAARRSYGTGSLYVRVDTAGVEKWYGHWRADGRQVKRCLGPKRVTGTRDGLTRRQAEAELRRVMAEHRPRTVVGERLTIAELGNRYLTHLERQGRKRATLVAVRSSLTNWLEPHFADQAVDTIRREHIDDLMRRMAAGGAGRRTKPLSPKSVRNHIGTLSAMHGYARRRKWASSNPFEEVDLPAVPRDEDIRFLDPVEVDALVVAAVEGPYRAIDRALYVTAAMTGLRQGELIALRWRDVDWTAARVRVRQNYVLGEFGTPKSRRSTRSVPMADAVAGELERLYQASRAQHDNDLVFADPIIGGPLSKAAILRRFRRALAAAHLDRSHRFHDLRHTFGTRCAQAGVPMRTLQEWMGHRDLATTQRYADYAPSPHEAALVAAAFASPATAAMSPTPFRRP